MKSAKEHFKKAADGGDKYALTMLVQCEVWGNPKEALRYHRLLSQEEGPAGLLDLARFYESMRDFKKAEYYYSEFSKSDPLSFDTELAEYYVRMKQFEKAEDTYIALGQKLEAAGNLEQAHMYYSEAQKVKEHSPRAESLIVAVQLKRGVLKDEL